MSEGVALELPVAVVGAPPNKPSSHARGRWAIIVAIAVLVASGGGVVAYRATRTQVSPFRTVRVERVDITERVTATGTLQPIVTSPVGAQVSGIVWKLHADYNSEVKAGQLLVELDPALFRNAVALARAQLAAAEANFAGATATAKGAKVVRERTTRLEQEALAGAADLDAASALFDQTAAMARAGAAQVAQARAQLARAELDLVHSIIRAPVDGTVISRNVELGQAVAATLTAPTLFTIAQDLHHMQVHAAVDEADVGEVAPGQTATFTVDAFRGETFSAAVREIRNAPQTASNVVTYDVVLDVENPEGKLRPGMTANVLILIVSRTQVAAVSNEALRFRPVTPAGATGAGRGMPAPVGAGVYVPQDGKAVRTAVRTGVSDGTMTEVSGLEPGREIIIEVRDKTRASPAGGPGRGL